MTISTGLLLVVLGFFVTARLTRFLTADFLAAPLRAWVIGRFGPASKLAYLVQCPWCMSVWVAVPPAVLVTVWGVWPVPAWAVGVGLVCAWSYVYGLLASNLDD